MNAFPCCHVAGLFDAGAEGTRALVVDELAVGRQAAAVVADRKLRGFSHRNFGRRSVRTRRDTGVEIRHAFCGAAPCDGRWEGVTVFAVTLGDGVRVRARTIVVATGVQYRRLPLARPEEFEGSAVFHAATGLEARHTQGRDAVVIGGGNSAGQAAMFLSRRAARVHLVARGASLAASMSDYLVERIGRNEAITLHFGAEVTALHDNDTLRAVTLRQNGIDHHLEAAGLFAMVGAARDTRRLSGPVILDDKGLVVTDGGHATSCPGIFAVGDVRAGSVKRVASAVGEGPVVISKVWEHVGAGQE